MSGHTPKRNAQRWSRAFATILITLGLCATPITADAAELDQPEIQGTAATPYQSALSAAIAERQAAGLPVPESVVFEVQQTDDLQRVPGTRSTAGVADVSIVATTTVEFAGPRQAGYDAWPRLVVEDGLPEAFAGTLLAGDYTEQYRTELAAELPGIWETYEFGQEPRTYITTETLNVRYPPAAESGTSSATEATTAEDILLGFTYAGPHIDYAIESRLEICLFGLCGEVYEFKAGFELDWALGLRLPAHATFSGPGALAQGMDYSYESALTPLDWSADQYAAAGVEPEDGNEFALRLYFFAGLKAEIFGGNICPGCYAELDFDESESFATPFGSDAEFPIPSALIPIYEIDLAVLYFGLGLEIDPHLTSTKITADWAAVPGSDCSGSGSLTYSAPDAAVGLGPVIACNLGPSDVAQVQLDNFRYYFNEFVINLLAYLDFEVFGYDAWHPTINIASIDLSSITGDLSLGGHVQCDALFNCFPTGPDNTLLLAAPVTDETPPVTSIALDGTAGTNGWYRSEVMVTLDADDAPAGCGSGVARTEYSHDGVYWTTYVAPFVLVDEGTHTVYYRSVDHEGNVEVTREATIRIDRTPPVISGAPTTDANEYGWYNDDVVVHFGAVDAVSGVAWVTPDQTLAGEGADQSVAGTAVDVAGNEASIVVGGINIDKTDPSVTIISPTAAVYDNRSSLTIDWTVTDGLSGVALEAGTLDETPVTDGQLVDLLLLAAGPHTVTATGADRSDNEATATVSFEVHVTPDGLLASLDAMCADGWIDQQMCNSLRAKVTASLAALDRGNTRAAKNALRAFIHELEAQVGKHVTEQAYDVLTVNAQYVLDELPPAGRRFAFDQAIR